MASWEVGHLGLGGGLGPERLAKLWSHENGGHFRWVNESSISPADRGGCCFGKEFRSIPFRKAVYHVVVPI